MPRNHFPGNYVLPLEIRLRISTAMGESKAWEKEMNRNTLISIFCLLLAGGVSSCSRARQAPDSSQDNSSAAVSSRISDEQMKEILNQARDLSNSGNFAEALALLRKAEHAGHLPDKPQSRYDVLDFKHFLLLKTGAFQEAVQTGMNIEDLGRKISERKSPWDCLKIADAYLGLKEYDKALDWIEKAVRERDFIKIEVMKGEPYAPLRESPRFQELLAGIEENLGLGLPALDFQVTLLDGTPFTLSAQKGKVVLIDFWDVRCSPCRKAMPHLKELHEKFADRGLFILGISLDTEQELLSDYLRKADLPWKMTCSFKGWNDETVKLYRINSTPSTWLIDRQGVLRYIDLSGEELTQAVLRLL